MVQFNDAIIVPGCVRYLRDADDDTGITGRSATAFRRGDRHEKAHQSQYGDSRNHALKAEASISCLDSSLWKSVRFLWASLDAWVTLPFVAASSWIR